MLIKVSIWFIKIYKLTLSPFIGRECRFEPTCSDYAIDALKEYGFFKGSYLAFMRIIRCNPFSQGGYDPVMKEEKDSMRCTHG